MNSREQFEAHYDDWSGNGPGSTKLERAKHTYRLPKISTAWIHWQASRAAVVVELPIDVTGGHYRMAVESCKRCIEAAGLKVAP